MELCKTDLLQKSKQIVKIFSLLCFSKSSEIRKLGNIFEKDRKSSLEIMKVFTRFKEELGREKLVEQSFPNFVSWEFFPTFLFCSSRSTTRIFYPNCVAMCPEVQSFQKRNYKTITIVKNGKKKSILNYKSSVECVRICQWIWKKWLIYIIAQWAKIYISSSLKNFYSIYFSLTYFPF